MAQLRSRHNCAGSKSNPKLQKEIQVLTLKGLFNPALEFLDFGRKSKDKNWLQNVEAGTT